MPAFIGREAELARIVEFVDSGRSGLVLILGHRRIGKRHLMQAVREELAMRHLVLPAVSGPDAEEPTFLTVTTGTTVAEVRALLTEGRSDPHSDDIQGSRVLMIYGYQPTAAMARWMRSEMAFSGVTDSSPHPASSAHSDKSRTVPTVIIIGALEEDLRALLDVAAVIERLEPLRADAVRSHLQKLTAGLVEPLGLDELEHYVSEISDDASLLHCFETVLVLEQAVDDPT
jgi:hypothetical protein